MRLTVLSPHRDDAAFSLALALKRWSMAGVQISVLNFFTSSAYAPFAFDCADVSGLRAREDRRSLKTIDPRIRLLSWSLLDAPLRLPIDFGSLTNPDAFALLPAELLALSRRLRPVFKHSLILAPLALGDHIDHRTVHQAVIDASRGRAMSSSLAFYEDLPYASWSDETLILQRVGIAEAQLGFPLSPSLQRSRNWRFKRHAAMRYRSQVDDSMANIIARYGEKYKNAERIWVPRHSARWRALLRGGR